MRRCALGLCALRAAETETEAKTERLLTAKSRAVCVLPDTRLRAGVSCAAPLRTAGGQVGGATVRKWARRLRRAGKVQPSTGAAVLLFVSLSATRGWVMVARDCGAEMRGAGWLRTLYQLANAHAGKGGRERTRAFVLQKCSEIGTAEARRLACGLLRRAADSAEMREESGFSPGH